MALKGNDSKNQRPWEYEIYGFAYLVTGTTVPCPETFQNKFNKFCLTLSPQNTTGNYIKKSTAIKRSFNLAKFKWRLHQDFDIFWQYC